MAGNGPHRAARERDGIMRRVVLVGVGFLLTLAGVVFTLQGVGVLGGSVMSGVTFWAVAGPVIALAGLPGRAYPEGVTGMAPRRFSRLPAHDGPPGGVSPR